MIVIDVKGCLACGQDHSRVGIFELVGRGKCSITDCPAPKGLCVEYVSPDHPECEYWEQTWFFICPANAQQVIIRQLPLTNPYETAKRKARYGHRDWLAWTDRQGERYAAPKSYDALKRALLSVGTKGTFNLYEASNGQPILVTWRIGVIMLRNAKWGV